MREDGWTDLQEAGRVFTRLSSILPGATIEQAQVEFPFEGHTLIAEMYTIKGKVFATIRSSGLTAVPNDVLDRAIMIIFDVTHGGNDGRT